MGVFSSKKHSTPGVQAVLFDIWGQRGWHNVDVVGESYHSREIRALLPSRQDDERTEVIVPVNLVHNPNNPHDRNAVEIRASTGLLGHLSRDDAARYASTFASLQQNGWTATTTARVWGYDREDWDTGKTEFLTSVRIDLPEPHMLVPANRPPSGAHRVLPIGAAIQVTGEENHMSAIAPYLNNHGECWIHTTLHEIVEQGPRSTKTLAEVHIDGNPVGRLTPKLSGDVLPAVNYLADHGQSTCVRAIVKGNHLKAEVVLYTLRAHELPADWFAAQAGLTADEFTSSATSEVISSVLEPKSSAGVADSPPPPPPGWYPDPQGVARLRYWDGTSWTDHTAP